MSTTKPGEQEPRCAWCGRPESHWRHGRKPANVTIRSFFDHHAFVPPAAEQPADSDALYREGKELGREMAERIRRMTAAKLAAQPAGEERRCSFDGCTEPYGHVCRHGGLHRKCDSCELDWANQRIAELVAELRDAVTRAAGLEAQLAATKETARHQLERIATLEAAVSEQLDFGMLQAQLAAATKEAAELSAAVAERDRRIGELEETVAGRKAGPLRRVLLFAYAHAGHDEHLAEAIADWESDTAPAGEGDKP
jgi:hypothetical protein